MEEKIEKKKDPIVRSYQLGEISQAALSHAPSLGRKKEVKSQEGMQAAASALPQTENK